MDNKTNSQPNNLPPIGKTLSEIQGKDTTTPKPLQSYGGKSLAEIQEESKVSRQESDSQEMVNQPPQFQEPLNNEVLTKTVDENDSFKQRINNSKESIRTFTKEEVEEEDDEYEDRVRRKDKKGGFSLGFLNPFRLLRNIKRITCFGCFTIFVGILVLLATIIFRPPLTWEPLKSFLNNNYNPPQSEELSIDDIEAFIDQNFEDETQNAIVLNEKQVTAIVKSKFSSEVSVDLEPGLMKLVVDADSKKENPLWLVVELKKTDDDKLEIQKIGFERFGLPSIINQRLGDAAFKAMNIAEGNIKDQSVNSALSFLSEGSEFIPTEIESITFEKDQLVVVYK